MAFLYGTSGAGDAAWTDTITDDTDFTGRITTTDGVVGGTVRTVGGLAFVNTADSAAITSTTSPTAYDVTYVVPANTLKQRSTLRVKATFRFTNTVGATTATLILRIGGVAIVTSSAVDVANADTAVIEGFLTTRGAPGAAVDTVGGGIALFDTGAAGTFSTATTMANGVTLATNGALTVDATVTYSAADATSSFLETLIVDVI